MDEIINSILVGTSTGVSTIVGANVINGIKNIFDNLTSLQKTSLSKKSEDLNKILTVLNEENIDNWSPENKILLWKKLEEWAIEKNIKTKITINQIDLKNIDKYNSPKDFLTNYFDDNLLKDFVSIINSSEYWIRSIHVNNSFERITDIALVFDNYDVKTIESLLGLGIISSYRKEYNENIFKKGISILVSDEIDKNYTITKLGDTFFLSPNLFNQFKQKREELVNQNKKDLYIDFSSFQLTKKGEKLITDYFINEINGKLPYQKKNYEVIENNIINFYKLCNQIKNKAEADLLEKAVNG